MKHNKYPKLFEKGYIGNLKVKNRIIRNSMGTYLADGNMYVGDRTIKAGAEAASGGAGVVFMDNCTIKEMYHMGLCAANDTYIPGLSMLAEAIKDHGALAGMQLSHPGRDTGFVGGTEVVAASSVTFEPWYEAGAALPKPLTIDEIHDLVDKYGQAALRCKKAGFDLVEVHGAGGCLPTNFLSPNDNQRNDMYGGSLHNRMRFLVEIVRSIKKYCGNNYPISIKLSIDDCEPNGIRVEETVEVAKVLEKEGVSMLNLMMGTHAVVYPSTGFYDINIYLSQAKQIKDAVQIPCMVGLGVQTASLAESILESGQGDFIALAKQEIADCNWPNKVKNNQEDDIRPCIKCLVGCTDNGIIGHHPIRCAVNPTVYKYYEDKYPQAKVVKNVVVIGAGPAGMEAALTLVKRGHKVTVYEKRKIGGTLHEASSADYKKDIKLFINYYEKQAQKYHLNIIQEEATYDTIVNGGYDACIIATGGKPRTLDVNGLETGKVTYALNYLNGEVKFDGENALVIGGGITGAEVAVELAKEGKKVTIIEVMDQFLALPSAVIPAYQMAVEQAGVKVITGHRLDYVDHDQAIIVDRFGNKKELKADGGIVISAGFMPQLELQEKLEEESDIEVYTVGDAKKVRQIIDATHEGYAVARMI